MQEWALSRRTLIFLKDSVIWSCRELCENERGNTLQLTRPSLEDWEHLVESYTGMALTYESDRLPAIDGVANLLQQGGLNIILPACGLKPSQIHFYGKLKMLQVGALPNAHIFRPGRGRAWRAELGFS